MPTLPHTEAGDPAGILEKGLVFVLPSSNVTFLNENKKDGGYLEITSSFADVALQGDKEKKDKKHYFIHTIFTIAGKAALHIIN